MGVPPVIIPIFDWDFPWNKPTILGYPHDYGTPHMYKYTMFQGINQWPISPGPRGAVMVCAARGVSKGGTFCHLNAQQVDAPAAPGNASTSKIMGQNMGNNMGKKNIRTTKTETLWKLLSNLTKRDVTKLRVFIGAKIMRMKRYVFDWRKQPAGYVICQCKIHTYPCLSMFISAKDLQTCWTHSNLLFQTACFDPETRNSDGSGKPLVIKPWESPLFHFDGFPRGDPGPAPGGPGRKHPKDETFHGRQDLRRGALWEHLKMLVQSIIEDGGDSKIYYTDHYWSVKIKQIQWKNDMTIQIQSTMKTWGQRLSTIILWGVDLSKSGEPLQLGGSFKFVS